MGTSIEACEIPHPNPPRGREGSLLIQLAAGFVSSPRIMPLDMLRELKN